MSGTVTLKLNQDKEARQFRIQIYGEKKVHRHSTLNNSQKYSMERIMESEIVLDGNKLYPAGSTDYNFEFTSPNIKETGLKPIPWNNPISNFLNWLISNMTDPYSNVKWYLDASLDLPMAFDISKRMEIRLKR